MIIADIKRNNGSIFRFEFLGHANYSNHGEDIVCAAVSVLSQTALLGLVEYAKIDIEYEIKDEDGFLLCEIPKELDSKKRLIADSILETMYLGLLSIEESYSSHIKIKIEEV